MKLFNPDEVKNITDFGGSVKFVVTRDIGSEMTCGLFTLQPKEQLKEFESHQTDEFFYIVSGELTVESRDNQPITAKKGQIVWIPKNEMHHSVNHGDEQAVIFWFNADHM